MDGSFRKLIEAAVRAPSGDNLQPWRFVVDPDACRIDVFVDETRDPSPMNAGQRMSRIAVGAAVENLVRCARSRGFDVKSQIELQGETAVAVHLSLSGSPISENLCDPAINDRVTNRRPYKNRPLPPETCSVLQRQTPAREGVRTHWIFDRSRISALARLIGEGDGIMFGEPSIRHAFLENVRFDLPADCEAEEGLPLGTLELAKADQFALRLLPYLPNWLFGLLGVRRKLAASAGRLVDSASGVCLLDQCELTPQMDILVGRAMQSAWLALTAEGMATQPMMSLVVLDNMICRDALPVSLKRSKVSSVLERFRELVPEMESAHPAFVMRFGFAKSASVRTSRLPLEANTSVIGAAKQGL